MSRTRVILVRRRFPRVHKHKYIIRSYAENDEYRYNVKVTEVLIVKHGSVDEVGDEEAGYDAEHGPPRHPQGARHKPDEEEDEEKTTDSERHVSESLRLDLKDEKRC